MNFNNKTRLEKMNESDLKMVLKWRNQDCIRKYMFNNEIIAFNDHRKWFDHLIGDPLKKVGIFYLNDSPCGFLQINVLFGHSCEWGFYIGDQTAPKGAGTVLGYLALNYIFDTLHMSRVNAEIIGFNKRSISYHIKFGFSKIDHQTKTRRDKTVDVVYMSLTKEMWSKNKKLIAQYIGGLEE